ncbi:putative protein tyrosine phosphatase (Pyp1), partial [Aspergillus tanneri]
MSAISGPRSPSSPWPSESPNLQRAGPSNPAALFPLYDPHPSPRSPNIKSPKTAPSGSGSSYFSISVDSCVNSRKKRDTSFYSQYSITNPESQCLPKKTVSDKAGVLKATLRPDERKESSNYALTLNRDPNKQKLTSDCSNSSLELNLGNYYAVSAEHCAELLESYQHDVMLLDVRPFAHFAKGNIKGSLNLCIPTTLLKRPSFDTKKLENTFTDESDKRSFARWRKCRYIAVYDAATSDVKDAVQLTNVLKKFTVEGWNGEGLILLGGFNAFSNRFPTFVQQKSLIPGVSSKPSPMQIDLPAGAPISGGCALPDVSHPIVPFFGNIRQHMDLLGGVGQIPLQLPKGFTEIKRKLLPTWLCEVADPADKGRNVSEKFLDIEKRELERMKQALSYNKSVDSTSVDAPRGKYRVAGIEKGAKNRYNDVYPFDHSRVRLQDVPRGDCDYVNANYMKAEYSNKRYIATQAPVPDTFNSKQLFQILVDRSFQQLYGAQFHARCTNFRFGAKVLDVKSSSLAPDDQILALVIRDQEEVHLFRAENGDIQHKAQLKLSLGQPGKIQVLKTAFDSDDGVYVLQRFTPTVIEDDLETGHPFIRQALQSSSNGGRLYLARHSFRFPHSPVRVCTFPDQVDFEPLAIAASHKDTFAISWQHVRDPCIHEVVLYTALTESSGDGAPGII